MMHLTVKIQDNESPLSTESEDDAKTGGIEADHGDNMEIVITDKKVGCLQQRKVQC